MEREPNEYAMGWAIFTGIMILMSGVWWLIVGFVALFGDGSIFVSGPDWAFKMTAPTWGVIHMLLGVVLVAAGVGIFRGAAWARTLGVILAVIGAIVAFVWLPYFPLWAVLHIAMSVTVIWALTVHGRDLAVAGERAERSRG